ncbi:MAG: beta-galactosidase small subunit, partial [Bacteroidota bacterium]
GSELLPTGYVIASAQFALPYRELIEMPAPGEGAGLETSEKDHDYIVKGKHFSISFNKENGLMEGYAYGYADLILKAPTPYFWREPNDNDHGFHMHKKMQVWKKASENRILKDFTVVRADTRGVELLAAYELPDVYSNFTIRYLIDMEGEVSITASLHPGDSLLPDMPRFGFYMEMNGSFDELQWFGRGPFENYIDRKTAAFVGLHGGKVADQHVSYIRPQENGNKCDVRWMTLSDKHGDGLNFSADSMFEFTVQHYRPADIAQETRQSGMHSIDVPKRNMVAVNIDKFQMGVGGNNSWGARPIEKYRYPAKEYVFELRIKPITK